jgi:hypothetical protein
MKINRLYRKFLSADRLLSNTDRKHEYYGLRMKRRDSLAKRLNGKWVRRYDSNNFGA